MRAKLGRPRGLLVSLGDGAGKGGSDSTPVLGCGWRCAAAAQALAAAGISTGSRSLGVNKALVINERTASLGATYVICSYLITSL